MVTTKPDRSPRALVRKTRALALDQAKRLWGSLERGVRIQPRGLVHVKYQGRMGNQLFQFCLGRIIAERLGFTLWAQPIGGFPETRWSGTPTSQTLGLLSPLERLTLHSVDLNAVLANRSPREVLLEGYFERYSYYRDHKESIRGWLACSEQVDAPEPGDAVVHVRSGDIWASPSRKHPSPIHAAAPLSYYRSILDRMRPDRVLIVTENAEDPVALRLRDLYQGTIMGQPALKDFMFLQGATRIILSVSTFAWWAAWLSRASEIHMPVWAGWHPDTKGAGTDLRVTGEDRYVFHDLGPKNDWRGDQADLDRTLNG